MKQYNVLICGVGGQGVMSLGMLLKSAALPEGKKVLGFEMRGLSQMEGAVTSSVRYMYGEDSEETDERKAMHSGSVPYGGTDLLIALEALEAIRNAPLLSRDTIIILNTYTICPREVEYPDVSAIIENLKKITDKVYVLDANELSMERYGSYRMANAMLLGAALEHSDLPIRRETIEGLLSSTQEREALDLGMNYIFE